MLVFLYVVDLFLFVFFNCCFTWRTTWLLPLASQASVTPDLRSCSFIGRMRMATLMASWILASSSSNEHEPILLLLRPRVRVRVRGSRKCSCRPAAWWWRGWLVAFFLLECWQSVEGNRAEVGVCGLGTICPSSFVGPVPDSGGGRPCP